MESAINKIIDAELDTQQSETTCKVKIEEGNQQITITLRKYEQEIYRKNIKTYRKNEIDVNTKKLIEQRRKLNRDHKKEISEYVELNKLTKKKLKEYKRKQKEILVTETTS